MLSNEAVSATEKRALVGRIVASPQFNKSERLSSFLLHICELSIEGRIAELSEKEIGHAVFQLPVDYDPSIDGIVRSHASRLRRKLEMYYLREGRNESVRIFIPRGGYQPRFESAIIQATASPGRYDSKDSPNPTPAAPITLGENLNTARCSDPTAQLKGQKDGYWRAVLPWFHPIQAIIGVVLLVSAFTFVSIYRIRTRPISLWNEMFAKQRPTIVVPGDSGVVMWQELQQKNLSLADYLSSSFWKSQANLANNEQQLALAMIGRRYTSMVDLDIAQKISHIAYLHNSEALLRYARDVRPNDLKHSNVVLIGSSETNPWNQMFQGQMNFILHKNQDKTIYTIENRQPHLGEPTQWLSDPMAQLYTVYCKASYLANPSGEGNILLLEGTSMAGTECAWEFSADQHRVMQFLRQASWSADYIPHFEVLLKTRNLGGDSAESSIVAWRIIR